MSEWHVPPHWREEDRRRWFWQGFFLGCSTSGAAVALAAFLALALP